MFTVIQVRDTSLRPLDRHFIRVVYAVDRATDSFLVTSTVCNEFVWIPIATCIPCREGMAV